MIKSTATESVASLMDSQSHKVRFHFKFHSISLLTAQNETVTCICFVKFV